jgi:transposase
MALVDPKDVEIAELKELVSKLLLRVAVLEAEVASLRQNSRNSSKPPSSDLPGSPRGGPGPTGRHRGGQPGHKHHKRDLLAPELVSSIINVVPDRCGRCCKKLKGSDPEPRRSQVVEVPPIKPHVTEYRQHSLCCDACGLVTQGVLPPEAASTFGPRLKSLIVVCTGGYRLSKRVTQELLSDFLGVRLALGSVSNIEREVSEALAAVVEEAREFVRKQAVVHADETGWREDKQRAWLWTASTAWVTVFQISRSRGAQVAKELLGEDFSGFLVVDRWAAYEWVPLRQLCWSHLLRDFQGFVDRGGVGGGLGEALLDQARAMFHLWHRVREKTLTRATFQRRMQPVEKRILRLLRAAQARAERKTAGMAKEILERADYLWTFVTNEDVPPTNNTAERVIRPAVLWRKGSFGTDSESGSRFAERVLSTLATLKQQGRHLLDYLEAACRAHQQGNRAPSLLPAGL